MGRGRRRFVTGAIALVLLAAMLAGCSRISAPPLTDDPKNIFARIKPATVQVIGEVGGYVVVPDWYIDPYSEGWTIVYDAVASGQVAATDEAALAAWVDVITSDPLTYILPADDLAMREMETGFTVLGSGFIVDPDGYVVTNAHVAVNSEDEIKETLATYGLQTWYDEDVEYMYSSDYGQYLTEDQVNALLDALIEFNYAYMDVTDITQSYAVYMGAEIPGVVSGIVPTPATVVEAGEASPGKDVAILKIDGENLPTIPIGDDADVSVGDACYAIGYPADATYNDYLSVESVGEPSFTSGKISAKKQSSTGFEVIQMDTAITHGNSGGPVVNSKGEVIGIATFGTVDENTGAQVGGFNFIMPSKVMNEFLDRAGANPAESTFTKLYNDALAEQAAGHLKDALKLYRQIDGMSPGQPYVLEHIALTERGIAEGKDQEISGPLLVCAPVALLVLIGAGVSILLLRRKKSQYAKVTPVPAGNAPAQAIQAGMSAPLPSSPAIPIAPVEPAPQADEPDPATSSEAFAELRELAALKDAGVITEAEFDEKKKEILGEI